MTQKRICSKCQKYTAVTFKGQICVTCFKKWGRCIRCQKQCWIKNIHQLCCCCFRDNPNRRALSNIEDKFSPKSKYNQLIFELYLKYIRRINIGNSVREQAIQFAQFLEQQTVSSLLSWSQIYAESQRYLIMTPKLRNSGCPFRKIGIMLEELGVLSARPDDSEIYFNKIKKEIRQLTTGTIDPFISYLRNSHRKLTTTIHILQIIRDFAKWLTWQKDFHLLEIHPVIIQKYAAFLVSSNYKATRQTQIMSYLRMFYRWCFHHELIRQDPCEKISAGKPTEQISICSQDQYEKIFKFIKNPQSNPEQAFLLTLIMVWALKNEDLRFARLEFGGDKFKIILANRKAASNRDQVLVLPSEPQWFSQLTIRFKQYWMTQYERLGKTFPHHNLILPRHAYVRTLVKDTVVSRIREATIAATGGKILPRTLRKTAGYLYINQNDASMLSRLGWCPPYTFKFLCYPKITTPPAKNKKRKNNCHH